MTDDPASTSGSQPGDHEAYLMICRQPDFIEVRRRHRRFVFGATVAFLGWYVLYLICGTWAPGLLATPVYGHLNVALLLGLLQFVSTVAIAWLYTRHAARELDPRRTKIRGEFEELTGRPGS